MTGVLLMVIAALFLVLAILALIIGARRLVKSLDKEDSDGRVR